MNVTSVRAPNLYVRCLKRTVILGAKTTLDQLRTEVREDVGSMSRDLAPCVFDLELSLKPHRDLERTSFVFYMNQTWVRAERFKWDARKDLSFFWRKTDIKSVEDRHSERGWVYTEAPFIVVYESRLYVIRNLNETLEHPGQFWRKNSRKIS